MMQPTDSRIINKATNSTHSSSSRINYCNTLKPSYSLKFWQPSEEKLEFNSSSSLTCHWLHSPSSFAFSFSFSRALSFFSVDWLLLKVSNLLSSESDSSFESKTQSFASKGLINLKRLFRSYSEMSLDLHLVESYCINVQFWVWMRISYASFALVCQFWRDSVLIKRIIW